MKRRELLVLGGTALGTLFTANLPNAAAEETSSTWTYEPLDGAQVAQRAYDLFAEGGCMYTAFRSIVEQVGLRRVEKHPLEEARWKGFPYRMMTYGKGGLQDYGSLCGVLNGCAAAIALFVTDREDAASLTHALFHFYEDTLLPIFVPASDEFGEIPQSLSESELCHVSVSRWTTKANETIDSPRRKERCKRLAGDVVAKAVELMNYYFETGECPAEEDPETAAAWGGAPAVLGESPVDGVSGYSPEGERPRVNVKMNCTLCHTDPASEQSK